MVMSVHGLLIDADSDRIYDPAGFDYMQEMRRVNDLSSSIKVSTKLRVVVDDPSGFQDGPLFTRILLFDDLSKDLPGQVLVSSFGSLVTSFELTDNEIMRKIRVAAERAQYKYVDYDELLLPYDGSFPRFGKMSWLSRYFNAFYVDHRMF